MPLLIREATRADLPAVLRLYAQPDFDAGNILSIERAEAIFERMRSYPDYRILLAEDDGAAVGTLALLIMDNLGHEGSPSAIVEDVAVDPARQGAGIGRALVLRAMERARAAGCYKLVLSSNARRERAHAFYESLGFTRHGYSFRVEPGA